ncbi:hypothetical protein Pan265_10390 [Mucisphaera calidilacus]|uniref:HEAT repeat protein n=1 Tax=Mucisphaera calidilacus TaxID=2527982 RepID=A0A518BW31_9BACT|nr:hypothetical protein Pan265_10390 [Mucisphaera calidilacus]
MLCALAVVVGLAGGAVLAQEASERAPEASDPADEVREAVVLPEPERPEVSDPLDSLYGQLTNPEGNGSVIRALDVLIDLRRPVDGRFLPVLLERSLDANREVALRARLTLLTAEADAVQAFYASEAADASQSVGRRVTAVRLLSDVMNRGSVSLLVDLARGDESARVRAEALRRLQVMLSVFLGDEPDLVAISGWWAEAQGWDDGAWDEVERDWSLAAARRQSVSMQVSMDRLTAAARRNYRLLTGDERASLLVSYLTDPEPILQQLGIDLVLQRLEEREAVSSPMRGALRRMIRSPRPELRERSIAVLLGLDDDEAADLVAGRLSAGNEGDPEVLAAMMRMLARKPRGEAVGVLAGWVGDPALGAQAVEALRASAAQGLVAGDVASAIRDRLLGLQAERRLSVDEMRLFGEVVTEADEAVVHNWLSDDRDSARLQAVRLWQEQPGWSLEPLVALLDDAMVGVAVREVLAGHRDAKRVAEAVLGRNRGDELATEVLRAVSPRLGGGMLLHVDDVLAGWSSGRAVRIEVLSSGLEGRDAQLAGVRVRLGELYIAEGREAEASVCLERLIADGGARGEVYEQGLALGVMAAARSDREEALRGFGEALLAGDEAGLDERRMVLAGLAEQLLGEMLALNEFERATGVERVLMGVLGEARSDAERAVYARLASMMERVSGEAEPEPAQQNEVVEKTASTEAEAEGTGAEVKAEVPRQEVVETEGAEAEAGEGADVSG